VANVIILPTKQRFYLPLRHKDSKNHKEILLFGQPLNGKHIIKGLSKDVNDKQNSF